MTDTMKLPFYARLALTLLAILLIIVFLKEGSSIFIPLVFALLISVLLFPLNKFIEHTLRLGRFCAAIFSVLIFIISISAFIYFLSLQIINFSSDLPELQKKLNVMIYDIQHWISYKYHVNTRQQTTYLNNSASSMIATAASSISNIFTTLISLAIWTIFTFIYTFFMLYHRRLLLKFVLHLFAPGHRAKVFEVVTESRAMMNGYVVGLLIEMVVVSIANCSLLLILGVKYAVLLGVIAAVLNIIPYLGIYTSIFITGIVTFANSGPNTALLTCVLMLAIHFVDANILMPRIVGSRVKMNPLITIVAVLVGNFIWGVPGMFLFIPITGILKLISERVEGLQPWAILIGNEESKAPLPKKKVLTREDLDSASAYDNNKEEED